MLHERPLYVQLTLDEIAQARAEIKAKFTSEERPNPFVSLHDTGTHKCTLCGKRLYKSNFGFSSHGKMHERKGEAEHVHGTGWLRVPTPEEEARLAEDERFADEEWERFSAARRRHDDARQILIATAINLADAGVCQELVAAAKEYREAQQSMYDTNPEE